MIWLNEYTVSRKMKFYPRMRVTMMPDCKNKVRIGFPDPKKYLKSGIIHDWAKPAAILIFSSKWRPLGVATLGAGRNRNSMLVWTYVPIFALLEEVEPNGPYIALSLRSLTTPTFGPATLWSRGGIHEWGHNLWRAYLHAGHYWAWAWFIWKFVFTRSQKVSHSGSRSQRLSYRLSTNELLHCVWAKGTICPASQSSWEWHNYITISQQCVGPNTRLILNTTHCIMTIGCGIKQNNMMTSKNRT